MKSWKTSVLAAGILCLVAAPSFSGYAAGDQVGLIPQVHTVPGSPSETAQLPLQDTPGIDVLPRPASDPAALWIPLIDADAARRAGVSAAVLHLALNAIGCAVTSGDIAAPPTVTLIDYSLPSVEPRLWVFETRTGELLYRELVAHGKGTGENMATQFSDVENSHQSSLGLFVTEGTYVGSNGYSLRLNGLEPGFNGRARDRAIVMHGAPYVDAAVAAKQGRLGRSWGCPALRQAIAQQVIDTVSGGGVISSYYPDQQWLETSRFLNCGKVPAAAALTQLSTEAVR